MSSDPPDPVARAATLRPLLAEHAAEADRGSVLSPQVVEAVREAGLFRLEVPAELGGWGASMRTQSEVLVELARACPSTAWLVGLNTSSTRLALRTYGDEVFRENPDVLLSSVGNSRSTARAVDGGYVLTGRGGFASGCEIADRVLFWGVPLADSTTTRVSFSFPAKEITVDRTWDFAGMRGTGSHTACVDELFVPDECASVATFDPGARTFANMPKPQHVLKSIAIALPVFVGATHGALDLVRDLLPAKPISDTVYRQAVDSPSARLWFAEAQHLLDTAYQHLWLVADECDDAPEDDVMAIEDRVRVRLHMSSAISGCRTALSKILDLAGASAFATGNPLQRFWRDFEVGTRHARFNPFIALEDAGQLLAGGSPVATMI
ncbi:acyl-CoA dehydrogenase family protein [Lentzea sp. NBRC 102530]|uniref:acyl-CoA dehydrogenase family protein n=1 Tax=Lentzea sp. NBRC 102530 TaxID=3032201 RepID=UPI0024A29529|nr:acyl-CoA dehydrogenase family protein [Lentzea sp. NBRC 102530]GLY46858.1 acyl-CoA dehydrogenase [Lentzea sp. NBRC 102530]